MNGPRPTIDDLVVRLRSRAADPERRVDQARTGFDNRGGQALASFAATFAPFLSELGGMLHASRSGHVRPGMQERLDEITGTLTARPPVADLPPPAPEARLVAAERHLGRTLPASLRTIYANVADGGFGPGGGLASIDEALHAWDGFRADPPGPRGTRWPETLLPILLEEGGIGCEAVDLESGRIVGFDPDGLTEHGRRGWERAFTEVAPDLATWLAAWVDAPTPREREAAREQAAMVEQARASRVVIAAMSPDERARMGLPEVGWERVVWGGIGLDEP